MSGSRVMQRVEQPARSAKVTSRLDYRTAQDIVEHPSPASGKVPLSTVSSAQRFLSLPRDFSQTCVVPNSSPIGGWIQTKLVVGATNDPLETEANAMADRVMQMGDPLATSAVASPAPESAGSVQRKCAECEEEERQTIRRCAALSPVSSSVASPLVNEVIQSSGSPLDTTTRKFMESRFGHDFSRVRVHADPTAAESARQIHARAYTVGSNIVFGAGQYAPTTKSGRHLLAHELTHTIQQGSTSNIVQRSEVDDDPRFCSGLDDLEAEVDEYVNTKLDEVRAKTSPGFENDPPEHRNFLRAVRREAGGIEQLLEDHDEAYKPSGHNDTKYSGSGSAPAPGRLGSVVRIADICVGSDKLGHFFGEGLDAYFAGSTDAAQKLSADLEITENGLAQTGVYSNADIVANMAGRDFYTELWDDTHMTFSVRNYIKPTWNEQVTTSFYNRGVADTVWENYMYGGPWTGFLTASGNDPAADIELRFTSIDMDKRTVEGQYIESFHPDGSDPNNQTTSSTWDFSGTVSFRNTHVGGVTEQADVVSGIELNIDIASGSEFYKSGWFISIGEKALNGRWGKARGATDGAWGVKRP